MAQRRFIVCCDGTWNTADQVKDGKPCPTNVTKLARAVTPRGDDGVEQCVYYDQGVGTGAFDHFRGGALGWGLSRNIRDAYMFLVERYEDGDEIVFFGFSRGAYTVRSTAGLLRNSGLLRREHAGRLDEAYALYRDRGHDTHPRAPAAERFRTSFAREVRIKLIGVWDTVGALGIPIDFPGVNMFNAYFQFHDVKLSTWVDNAFQALAIDERRKPFEPAIWEQQVDDLRRGGVTQRLEQVWFAGVHSDVGGGYPEAALSDIALAWLARRARTCGLTLDFAAANPPVEPRLDGPLHDSMTFYYRILGELVRPIPRTRVDPDGREIVTRESVFTSAVDRRDALPGYRPANMASFLDAGGPVTTD